MSYPTFTPNPLSIGGPSLHHNNLMTANNFIDPSSHNNMYFVGNQFHEENEFQNQIREHQQIGKSNTDSSATNNMMLDPGGGNGHVTPATTPLFPAPGAQNAALMNTGVTNGMVDIEGHGLDWSAFASVDQNAPPPMSSQLQDASSSPSISNSNNSNSGHVSLNPSGCLLIPSYALYTGSPSYLNKYVDEKWGGKVSENTSVGRLKREILKRQKLTNVIADPSECDLPNEVDNFSCLVPLEDHPATLNAIMPDSTHNAKRRPNSSGGGGGGSSNKNSASINGPTSGNSSIPTNTSGPSINASLKLGGVSVHLMGYATSVYKAVNVRTGQHVCLRRVHGYRLVNAKCMANVEKWKRLPPHSNLVSLREVFTTKLFDTKNNSDQSVVFVYDYHPGGDTLLERYFPPSASATKMLPHSSRSDVDGNSSGPNFDSSTSDKGSSSTDSSSHKMRPVLFANNNGGKQVNRPYSQQQHQQGPSSMSRMKRELDSSSGNPEHSGNYRDLNASKLLPESLIWTHIIQLTSVIRHVHSAGLSIRCLDISKVLITYYGSSTTNHHHQTSQKSASYAHSPASYSAHFRLLVNCCGIVDVLSYPSSELAATVASTSSPHQVSAAQIAEQAHFQQKDLNDLGRIVLILACKSLNACSQYETSLKLISNTYSKDLVNLVVYLASPTTPSGSMRSVNDLMPMIGARFYTQLESANQQSDALENELNLELESSRLFRVLCKLNTVVERADLSGDFMWSECGENYMLKLFRDYIFHQVDENGHPWMDMSHIVSCLNKFDAGVPDKICLMSRDNQNILLVSYSELKCGLEKSFMDCSHASSSSSGIKTTYDNNDSTPLSNAFNNLSFV